jgi:hypothetical protein
MSSSTPASSAIGSRSAPSLSAARATAIASIRADLPRSRPLRRAPAIDRVANEPRARHGPARIAQPHRRHVGRPPAPQPLGAQTTRPTQDGGEAALTDLDRLVAQQLAAGCGDRGDRVRTLVHVRTEHDRGLRFFHLDRKRTPGGHGSLGGAATLLSSSAGTTPTGDERHSESQSGPRADSVNCESPLRRSGSLYQAGRHRRNQKQQERLQERGRQPRDCPLWTSSGSTGGSRCSSTEPVLRDRPGRCVAQCRIGRGATVRRVARLAWTRQRRSRFCLSARLSHKPLGMPVHQLVAGQHRSNSTRTRDLWDTDLVRGPIAVDFSHH